MGTAGSPCYITKFPPSVYLLSPRFAVLLGDCLCFLEKMGNNSKIPNPSKALVLPLKTQPVLIQPLCSILNSICGVTRLYTSIHMYFQLETSTSYFKITLAPLLFPGPILHLRWCISALKYLWVNAKQIPINILYINFKIFLSYLLSQALIKLVYYYC